MIPWWWLIVAYLFGVLWAGIGFAWLGRDRDGPGECPPDCDEHIKRLPGEIRRYQ